MVFGHVGFICCFRRSDWSFLFVLFRKKDIQGNQSGLSNISVNGQIVTSRSPRKKFSMNPEKLAKLQAQVRIGGKGTPRRKVKKAPKTNVADDKKLQLALKKLNVQPLTAIEEVNMFQKDGNILHFSRPTGILNSSSPSISCNQYVCD
jgi:hypothetical protein